MPLPIVRTLALALLLAVLPSEAQEGIRGAASVTDAELAIAANDVLDLEVVGDRALTLRARAHGRGDLVATVHR